MTKLLTTPALHACDEDIAFVAGRRKDGMWPRNRWWFCISSVQDIFDLPDVKKLWFEFHDSPGVDRCYVQVIEHETDNTDMLVLIDGIQMDVSGFTGRMIADYLDRKSCYVECKFEEEDA